LTTSSPPAPAPRAASRAHPRGPKRLLFIILAATIPLALIVLVEVGLRLAGLGGYPAIIKRACALPDQPGSSLWITDNEGTRSFFFANPNRPGSLDDAAVVMPKPAGTVRIVAVGESAMKGFPQPRALSSAEFLRAMLSDLWPDRKVEVINLGCTAVASYPVLEILTQALQLSPDLVIVYVGNNEFFGAYGVASLNRAGAYPGAMRFQRWARSTAIVQGVSRLFSHAAPQNQEGKTLMETMMGRSFTAPDDPIRNRAASNLEFFVGAMIDRCKAASVPSLVCTLPCNKRDLAPLGDCDQVIPAGADRDAFARRVSEAEARLGSDPRAAADSLAEAVKQHPGHARAHFELARALESLKDNAGAREHYQRAVDLDPMPWRPPSASVGAIRAAVAAHVGRICDLEAAFDQAAASLPAPTAAPGWDYFDDHVHPTLRGQDLIARTILQSLVDFPQPLHVDAAALAGLAGFDDYARRLGENDFERYGVAHQMRVLAKIPFFTQTNPGMYPRFDGVCKQLEASWDQKLRDIAVEWQKPETHQGARKPISAMAGKVELAKGNIDAAEKLYESAVRSVFPYSSWSLEYELYVLGCRQQRTGAELSDADKARARAAIARGMVLFGLTGGGMTERHIGMLHQALGEYEQSVPILNSARRKLYEDNKLACDAALVKALVRLGRTSEARIIAEDGARNAGKYAPTYQKMLQSLPAK